MNHFHPEERLQIVWACIVITCLVILAVIFYLYGYLIPTAVNAGLMTFLSTCCGIAGGYYVGDKGFIRTVLADEGVPFNEELLSPNEELLSPEQIEASPPVVKITMSQSTYGLRNYDGSPIVVAS